MMQVIDLRFQDIVAQLIHQPHVHVLDYDFRRDTLCM